MQGVHVKDRTVWLVRVDNNKQWGQSGGGEELSKQARVSNAAESKGERSGGLQGNDESRTGDRSPLDEKRGVTYLRGYKH